MVRDVSNKNGGANCDTCLFLYFVPKEELTDIKVTLYQCAKLIVKVNYLFTIFDKFTRIELEDNIVKRFQR